VLLGKKSNACDLQQKAVLLRQHLNKEREKNSWNAIVEKRTGMKFLPLELLIQIVVIFYYSMMMHQLSRLQK
jgi:hypothetical protein